MRVESRALPIAARQLMAIVVGLLLSFAMVTTVIAAGTVNEMAIVGAANASPGPSVAQGGIANFQITMTADEGNINSSQADNGWVTVATKYVINSAGQFTADTTVTQTQSFPVQNFSQDEHTLTFNATVEVASDALCETYSTAGVKTANGSQVNFGVPMPTVFATVTGCAAADTTPPVTTISLDPATANGNNGWYASAVTVTISATDDDSGVDETRCALNPVSAPATFADLPGTACPYLAPASGIVSADGEHTIYAASADNEGNAEGVKSASFKIDQTAPTVILTTPANGAVYLLGEVVNADFSCNDATSGIASCVGTVANGAPIDTGTVGTKSFSVSATDNAGNQGSAQVSYTVAYDFNGFYQPVKYQASEGTFNTAKAGQRIPLKWSLVDANDGYIQDTSVVGPIRATQVACNGAVDIDPIDEDADATGSSGLRYDTDDEQFIFAWATQRSWAGKCFEVRVSLNDGSSHAARFSFTR